MKDTLTREQVRAVDAWAIEHLKVPALVLMENAGRQVADVACKMLDDAGGGAVGVLAGAGNNGGDGFVAARHLRLRGLDVRVWRVAPPEKLSDDAAENLRVYRALGGAVEPVETVDEDRAKQWGGCAVLIDALGGTGIRGALRGLLAEAVEAANVTDRPILAVDIPTGLDCDTGQAEGPAVRAAKTVTFVARKAGFDVPDSRGYTGAVLVADIGVPLSDWPGL